MRSFTLLVGLLLLVFNVFAGPISLGIAGNYDVFVQNNFTVVSSDTQGRVAIGGDLNVAGQYDIGYKINDFDMGEGPSVIVSGDVNKSKSGYLNVYEDGKHQSPHSGELLYSGNLSNSIPNTIEAMLIQTKESNLPFNFDNEFSYLNTLSLELSSRTASGTTESKWNVLNVNATSTPTDNIYVFEVTQEQLNESSEVKVNDVSDDATIIFNVTNDNNVASRDYSKELCEEDQVGCITMKQTTVSINGMYKHENLQEHSLVNRLPSQILYNFSGITKLNLFTNIFGTILAPSAEITAQNGVIWGSVIGKSWESAGAFQINHDPFIPSLFIPTDPRQISEVAAPGSIFIVMLGLGILILRGKLRN
jgi:choice-of-anchor A domain-containing protein